MVLKQFYPGEADRHQAGGEKPGGRNVQPLLLWQNGQLNALGGQGQPARRVRRLGADDRMERER